MPHKRIKQKFYCNNDPKNQLYIKKMTKNKKPPDGAQRHGADMAVKAAGTAVILAAAAAGNLTNEIIILYIYWVVKKNKEE